MFGELVTVTRNRGSASPCKVADCVCLMSLDKAEAVPVDTHVWQIAKRDYSFAPGSGQKSITDKLHRDLGQLSYAPHQ